MSVPPRGEGTPSQFEYASLLTAVAEQHCRWPAELELIEPSPTMAADTIARNGTNANHSGIDLFGVSTARTRGNTIKDNQGAAVAAGTNSYYRNGVFNLGGGPDPADTDVIVQLGCTQGAPPGSCGEPDTSAVFIVGGAVGDFRNANITGEVFTFDTSLLRAQTSEISGNMLVGNLSEIFLPDSVVGNGTVSCFSLSIGPAFTGCGDSLPSP